MSKAIVCRKKLGIVFLINMDVWINLHAFQLILQILKLMII
jgi:hypothetical protein